MGWGKRNVTAALLLCSLCFASENDAPKSNREIFFRLCDSAMNDIVSADLTQSVPVTLKTGSDHHSSYYRPQFIQGLVSKNVPVYVDEDSSATTLELTVRESSVLYGGVFTVSFLGERLTERMITLTINAAVISRSDGKVIEARQISRTYTDTVAYSIAEQLNDPMPPLTGYRKPELTFFDSIIEPAIVTIASGVAIYLFFTIRS